MANVAVRVKWEDAKLLLRMRNGNRKLAYAVVNALNFTGLAIQEGEQDRVMDEFHPRTANTQRFLKRQAGYFPKSQRADVKAGRFHAEVSVGHAPRLLLSEFEAGGQRRPFVGKHAAIPVIGGARPTARSPVPAKFWFTRLSFSHYSGHQQSRMATKRQRKSGSIEFRSRITSTGKVQWRGSYRTFIFDKSKKFPFGGVMQRVGAAKRALKLIYFFGGWDDLKARLRFIVTARRIAQKNFNAEMSRQVQGAFLHLESTKG